MTPPASDQFVVGSTGNLTGFEGLTDRFEHFWCWVKAGRDGPEHRALSYYDSDPSVAGSHQEHLPGRVRVAPDSDPVRIMVFDRRGERDGVSIAAGLHPRVDLLAWLTSADPQISMVIEEGRHPSLSEHLGIPVGDHRDDGGGAMSHHHQREWCLAPSQP
jgi:hypothetical protein